MIWLANAQVLEKDLVNLLVIVLASVDQHVITVLVQRCHDTRQTNDFRARAYHCNNFQLLHFKAYSLCDQAWVPTAMV